VKVIQLVKQLNNTELGKGRTHDTYVLIPNELDITDIFTKPNDPIEFHDVESMEKVVVRNTVGREKRIVGLGQYYRSRDLSAGDEIIFERRISDSKSEYRVTAVKHQKIIVFQKAKSGFEILTPERLNMAKLWGEQSDDEFCIDFLCSAKKRNDSPDTTEYYDISINGKSLLDSYSGKDIGIISLEENKVKINSSYGWEKYYFEMGEYR
jgi:hypothetical protein